MAKIPYSKTEVEEFYKKTKDAYERALSAQEYDLSGLGVKRASIATLKRDLLYWAYCKKNLEENIDVEPVVDINGNVRNPVSNSKIKFVSSEVIE